MSFFLIKKYKYSFKKNIGKQIKMNLFERFVLIITLQQKWSNSNKLRPEVNDENLLYSQFSLGKNVKKEDPNEVDIWLKKTDWLINISVPNKCFLQKFACNVWNLYFFHKCRLVKAFIKMLSEEMCDITLLSNKKSTTFKSRGLLTN